LGANLGNVLVWIKGYFNLVCVSGRERENDDTGFADTQEECYLLSGKLKEIILDNDKNLDV